MIARLRLFSREFWTGDGGEGALMRSVFYTLVTASALMLALDLDGMIRRGGDGFVDGDRTEPVVMEPPKDTDQVRPYYPKAMPMAPGSDAPRIPGLTFKPTPKMLAEPMTFSVDDAGNAAAIGRIEPGTATRFEQFLAESPGKVKHVWFHSPGGSVADAIAIARSIRKNALATDVAENAYCASSCPLAFAGGTERQAGKKSWIGVHQVFALSSEVGTLHDGLADAQRVSADCQQHLVAMGVDPRAWIHAMRTAKNRLYVFTPKELAEYKLVTKTVSPSASAAKP